MNYDQYYVQSRNCNYNNYYMLYLVNSFRFTIIQDIFVKLSTSVKQKHHNMRNSNYRISTLLHVNHYNNTFKVDAYQFCAPIPLILYGVSDTESIYFSVVICELVVFYIFDYVLWVFTAFNFPFNQTTTRQRNLLPPPPKKLLVIHWKQQLVLRKVSAYVSFKWAYFPRNYQPFRKTFFQI